MNHRGHRGHRVLASCDPTICHAPSRFTTMSVTTRDALSGATATWDFGDGTTEEGESFTKAFLAPGAFTVRVTVTDSAGNTTTVHRAVTVAQQRG